MESTKLSRREFLIGTVGILLVPSAIAITGCSENSPLVGKWTTTASNSSVPLLEFKSDGTFSYYDPDVSEEKQGKWGVYKNNPVSVDGEDWYIYTADGRILGFGDRGGYSEELGGSYQNGRADIAVKDNHMYVTFGYLMRRSAEQGSQFDEGKIREFLNNDTGNILSHVPFTKA